MSDQFDAVALPTGRTADLVRGAPVAVLGFGISNRPLVNLLRRMTDDIRVYDKKSPAELGVEALEAEGAGVRFFCDLSAMELPRARVVFRSPGFRPDLDELAAARTAGAVVTSEMAWFLEVTRARVIGITGSDGKTTTSTLTAKMLEAGGHRVCLGGNIGQPLLPLATQMTETDFAVVELSSFQLIDLRTSPCRSAVTNVSPNHLNWHKDMDEYAASKTNIFRNPECGTLVLNAENAVTASFRKLARPGQKTVMFSSLRGDPQLIFEQFPGADAVIVRDGVVTYCTPGREVPVVRCDEILLPARHNLENMMTAIALTHGFVPPAAQREVAMTFRGVEHRLERVREVRGVTYYNSSIDSSPTRTAAALSALSEPIVAICGGYDKNIPFAPLAEALCARARAVVLTGATAEKIRAAIVACPAYRADALPVTVVPDFRAAVLTAAGIAEAGDAVLLSPACASFDAFRNFEERGNTFKEIVQSLL